jgi:hypothetical protein
VEHDAEATLGARRSGILLVMRIGPLRRAPRPAAAAAAALGAGIDLTDDRGAPDAAGAGADVRRRALGIR